HDQEAAPTGKVLFRGVAPQAETEERARSRKERLRDRRSGVRNEQRREADAKQRGIGKEQGLRGSQRHAHDSGLQPHTDAEGGKQDRKSTRLNSSHDQISYAV